MSGAGLGTDPTSGKSGNQLSELQEQFIADIIQGVIVDELKDYKDTLQFAESAPGTGDGGGHPMYVESDGGAGEDIITLVEEGYLFNLKVSSRLEQTTLRPLP